ncbi:MAG: hypothetical protein QOF72_1387, partial [Blastocatellia bacterium]|nr:hypothetical protein [Blastocatellia bacterium]
TPQVRPETPAPIMATDFAMLKVVGQARRLPTQNARKQRANRLNSE